jgi:hypothetical protein
MAIGDLENEINEARKDIISDGYDMSVGEVINLYKEKEIIINPIYQRLFRWDNSRKTRFIESLLLAIPVPPIFVYQNENGTWELIDGLQRLSTILEFTGFLRGENDELLAPSTLEGTNLLPSLANKVWAINGSDSNEIGVAQQLKIKRARLRVEILKQESDVNAKYELFQRLNTGGVGLSEQEVRNCVAVMMDVSFSEWLQNLAQQEIFLRSIEQTEVALNKQVGVELALRFLCFRNVPYTSGLDVHEYLDKAMIEIIKDQTFKRANEEEVFEKTFRFIHDALGSNAFKKWNGTNFQGKFLMSVYEVIAIGVSRKIADLETKSQIERNQIITQKAQELWDNPVFQRNSGAGVRGTTRLSNLLPLSNEYFNGI